MEDYKFLADKEMKEVILFLEDEYKSLKTGHINKSLFDKVFVSCYGEKSPLNQVATITIPEARLVIIQPWDKGLLSKIEQAILNSDLSMSPINDGSIIRIKVPALTNERRKELVKRSKNIAEEFRVRIRNIRQELNNKAKKQEKNSEITEDDLKIVLEEIQKITDSYIKKIDELVDMKIKEIMKI